MMDMIKILDSHVIFYTTFFFQIKLGWIKLLSFSVSVFFIVISSSSVVSKSVLYHLSVMWWKMHVAKISHIVSWYKSKHVSSLRKIEISWCISISIQVTMCSTTPHGWPPLVKDHICSILECLSRGVLQAYKIGFWDKVMALKWQSITVKLNYQHLVDSVSIL